MPHGSSPPATYGSISSSRCQTTKLSRFAIERGKAKDECMNEHLLARRRRSLDGQPSRSTGSLANRSREAAQAGGARRNRTDDLLLAKQALSQLSYGPALDWLANRSLRPPARASPFGLRRATFASLRERRLVGLGRFELPTSRLSSARSNQLSYKPNISELPHAEWVAPVARLYSNARILKRAERAARARS